MTRRRELDPKLDRPTYPSRLAGQLVGWLFLAAVLCAATAVIVLMIGGLP